MTAPTGATGPFLSSYIEVSAVGQTVAQNADIVFDVGPEEIDIVGTAFRINAGGSVITILEPGLYHVEWSLNLTGGTTPTVIGTVEGGYPGSAHANATTVGSYSSGALISVSAGEVPFTVSLRNFGAQMMIGDAMGFEGVAGSLRIVKIADGPSV